MKPLLTKIFIALALLFICLPSQGQMMYTRKARLEDFPARTLKVVAGGQSLLELCLREEVSSRWRVSPFEFCTADEYRELREDNGYYFLTVGTLDGIAFLSLSKGGRDDESDNLKKPFEVVRIPIAEAAAPSGRALMYMGAFVDILQNFAGEAVMSEQAAYAGLRFNNRLSLEGRKVLLDPDEADSAYQAGDSGVVTGLVITPSAPGDHCYKMLITPDTHEILYFSRARYRDASDGAFTAAEIRQFERRNGIIP